MIFYITSPVYLQQIQNAITQAKQYEEGKEVLKEINLFKYIKENLSRFSTVEKLIIDLNVVKNMDEEIIEILDSFRVTYPDTRIIILASGRRTGDPLLTRIFRMGIYNIIITEDFAEILEELKLCLTEGKKYKDSKAFNVEKADSSPIVKKTLKRDVQKVFIAVAGAQSHIGVTHNAIVLANWLKKQNFYVALVECNSNATELESSDYYKIKETYEESIYDNQYFQIGGVDFYPFVKSTEIAKVISKPYNFIIGDFGQYAECDKITFEKAEERIVICGAKPWEWENFYTICMDHSPEAMQHMHFYFTFIAPSYVKMVNVGMEDIGIPHFLNYNADPFISYDFADGESIFKSYLPETLEEKSKWWKWGKYDRKAKI